MRKIDFIKFKNVKNNIEKILFYQTLDCYNEILEEYKRKDIKYKEPINLVGSNEIYFINSYQKAAVLRRRTKRIWNFNLNARSKKISKERSVHAKKRKRDRNGKFIQTKDIYDNFNFDKLFN